MIKHLPSYERGSSIFQSLMDIEAQEIDNRAAYIENFIEQLLIDTATWGLTIYEQELEIKTDVNKSYEERRSAIKSKLRGMGKVDSSLIKLVSDAHTNGDVEVTFDGRINIEFISFYGVPPNKKDLEMALEEIKPAHLDIEFIYNYLTWNEFDEYNKNWNQWDALNLSWDDFEIYKEVL